MSNKHPSPNFAEIIPTGTLVLLCGIGAISMLFQNLVIACFLGTIGIKLGATTLRMQVEKLYKIFAAIGMALSIVPLIYAIVIFV